MQLSPDLGDLVPDHLEMVTILETSSDRTSSLLGLIFRPAQHVCQGDVLTWWQESE